MCEHVFFVFGWNWNIQFLNSPFQEDGMVDSRIMLNRWTTCFLHFYGIDWIIPAFARYAVSFASCSLFEVIFPPTDPRNPKPRKTTAVILSDCDFWSLDALLPSPFGNLDLYLEGRHKIYTNREFLFVQKFPLQICHRMFLIKKSTAKKHLGFCCPAPKKNPPW